MINKNERTFVKHIKGLFQPDLLRSLREKVSFLASKQAEKNISEREKHAVLRGESIDDTRMCTDWYAVWKNPTSRAMLLDTISPFTQVIYPVQVRYVRNTEQHYVPWHQDMAYIRLLGNRSHQQVITCFIPLEEEPAKCTTIQFAQVPSQENPLQLYQHAPADGFGAGIQETDFTNKVHYDLSLGDALLFGDHTVHRTYLPENGSVERRSLEFRLVMQEHVIPEKDYFDIENSVFVRFDEKMQLISPKVA